MPKIKDRSASRSRNGSSGFHLSYATLGAIATLLTLVGGIVTIGSRIATKTDVESIKTAITPTLNDHESRVRSLELQMARYFGASQTSTHPSSDVDEAPRDARLVLSQYQQQSPNAASGANAVRLAERPRRVVIPQEVIDAYHLQPSSGGVYAVLGEDGRLYPLDDILALILRMHVEEQRGLIRKK